LLRRKFHADGDSCQCSGCKKRNVDGGLEEKTAVLGTPKIQGKEAIDGKSAPALYFGSTKMNNNFSVVD